MSRPYNDLVIELRRCTKLVQKQKSLLQDGKLADRDVDFVFEIAFLSAYVSFEVFVERQFEALLAGKSYFKGRKVKRRLGVRSEIVARDLIKGTKQFPKFLPIEELEKLAAIFFRKGEPFSLLSERQKNALRKGRYIRNLIAHRSRTSRAKFESHVLAGVALRKTKRNPAGYLRSPVSSHQDRFEQIVSDLAIIGHVFVN